MSDIPKDGTAVIKQEPTEARGDSETDSCEFLDGTEDLDDIEVMQKDQESCNKSKCQVAKVYFSPRMLIYRAPRGTL